MEKKIKERLYRLFNSPNKGDILYFLGTENKAELESLYNYANHIGQKFVGDAVHIRAIIEFSNYCKQSCLYCGLNKRNQGITRYRIQVPEIIDIAQSAIKQGFKTIVLQSGEDSSYTQDHYLHMIREIKKTGDVALTLAWGEKSREDYQAYFDAGADRFLLKHETSDPELYRKLNPQMSYENQLLCLKNLKEIGFQTGSGIMI
jgi:biotin synthase